MVDVKKYIKRIIGKTQRGKNDWDFDGIINSKDCQPRNTMRQDAYGRSDYYYNLKKSIQHPHPDFPMSSEMLVDTIKEHRNMKNISQNEANDLFDMI